MMELLQQRRLICDVLIYERHRRTLRAESKVTGEGNVRISWLHFRLAQENDSPVFADRERCHFRHYGDR